MSKFAPWMPFYVTDYEADTSHLSFQEHGAYFLLIKAYWKGGPLPADDADLARIVGMPVRLWKTKYAKRVRYFFQQEGDFLRHKRIDAERDKAAEKIEKRAEFGRLGGQAKAANRAEDYKLPAQRPSNGLAKARALPKQTAAHLDVQIESKQVSSAQARPRSFSDLEDVTPEVGGSGRGVVGGVYLDVAWAKACEAMDVDPTTTRIPQRPVIEWLKGGWSTAQIAGEIRRVMRSKQGSPPSTFSYFDGAIRAIRPENRSFVMARTG